MKKALKGLYYLIFFIAFILYLIVIGVILTYIFNFLELQDLIYWLKQLIMMIIVFLLMRPTLFVFMGWIATKLGLTKEDFIKKAK